MVVEKGKNDNAIEVSRKGYQIMLKHSSPKGYQQEKLNIMLAKGLLQISGLKHLDFCPGKCLSMRTLDIAHQVPTSDTSWCYEASV